MRKDLISVDLTSVLSVMPRGPIHKNGNLPAFLLKTLIDSITGLIYQFSHFKAIILFLANQNFFEK